MIDFNDLYNSLTEEMAGNQKRLPIDSVLGVYFGLSPEGHLRLSFASETIASKLESTKMLKVSQGAESDNVYWTCFDLLVIDAKKVFFTFCGNLIEAIIGVTNEQQALLLIKKRYITWKTMFKKEPAETCSIEKQQGLFGELYFLKEYMIEKYGIQNAIQAWSGPDGRSKDFSVDSDWFEIKTIGANAANVHISSLAQLSSDTIGRLIIIRVETMSEEFDNGHCCIGDLFQDILSQVNDETLEGIFLSKISAYGFNMLDNNYMAKYNIKSITKYLVDDKFPRLKENDIIYPEICDVEYSLIVNGLNPYKEI